MILPDQKFLDIFRNTNGALSVCESIAIMNLAAMTPTDIPTFQYLELGTHLGKSAISAMCGLKAGYFYLVDPIFEDDKTSSKVQATIQSIQTNNLWVYLVPDSSLNEIVRHDNYSWVFIDSGDHQELPMQEVKLLEDRVIKGGIIAFHDFDSQFLQVREAYNYLLSTGKYEEIKIYWQPIIDYVKENDLEKGNQSWHHQEMDFPCFVGAVRKK